MSASSRASSQALKKSEPTLERISQIVESVTQLYTGKPFRKQQILASIYSAQRARFHDPLVDVTGRENLFAQFFALTFFSRVTVDLEKVEQVVKKDGDKWELNFKSTQTYYARNTPIVIKASTKLDLCQEDGNWLVAEHHDVWLDRSFELPTSIGKRIFGQASSLLLRAYLSLMG